MKICLSSILFLDLKADCRPESPTIVMMRHYFPTPVSSSPHAPDRLREVLPSWLISCIFHVGCIVVLAHLTFSRVSTSGNGIYGSETSLTQLEGTESPSEPEIATELPPARVDFPQIKQVNPPTPSPPSSLASTERSVTDAATDTSSEENLLADSASATIIGPPVESGHLSGKGGGKTDGRETGGKSGARRAPFGRLSGGPSEKPAGSPGRQRAAFLGLNAPAQRVVYVIDCSASMSQNHRLQVAQRELLRSISRLDPKQQFEIVFYRDKPIPMSTWDRSLNGLRPATPENLKAAEQFVRQMDASNGTDHIPAIRQALALSPDVIFLLTDASEPRLTDKEIREIAQACRGKIHVYAIEFGILADAGSIPSFLKKLADRTAADYRYFDVTRFSEEQIR